MEWPAASHHFIYPSSRLKLPPFPPSSHLPKRRRRRRRRLLLHLAHSFIIGPKSDVAQREAQSSVNLSLFALH